VVSRALTPNGKIPQLSYSNVYVVQSSNRSTQWYIDRYGCLHFEVKKEYSKMKSILVAPELRHMKKVVTQWK
jgi:hypothetical protein